MTFDKKIWGVVLILIAMVISVVAYAQMEQPSERSRIVPGKENVQEDVVPEQPIEIDTSGGSPVKSDVEGPLTDEEKVYLNVQEADIKDVIKQISKATGRNFIIDDKIRGKVTIISERPMTREEAYQTFLSALEVAGYTTVKGPANIIKIVSLKEASKSPIPTHVDSTPYTDSFVTRLLALENISALDMSNAIKDLISKEGNLFAYPATNTLIITDSGANIDRLMKIIKELDQEGPQQVMEIVPIRNARATDVAKMVQDLFQKEKKAASKSRRSTRRGAASQLEELAEVSKIIADERTNSIIVLASKRAIENVRSIIQKLDSRLRPEDEGRIHVYYLKHAKAKDLSETLSALTATAGAKGKSKTKEVGVAQFEGGVKISADESTNALVITATPKDYKTLIERVISKLDIPRRQVYFEAVVMEMNLTKGAEYGVQGYGGAPIGGSAIGMGQTLGGPALLGSMIAGSATGGTSAWPGLLGGLISSTTTDLTYVGTDGTSSTLTIPAFSAFLSLLATRGEANVVSTPNLLTLDNEEATMNVLSKEPTPGSTSFSQGVATTQSIDYKEAGLELKIKPQITEGDMIMLEIEQKLSGFSTPRFSTNLNAPAMKERTVKTTVVTENAQTVVLAGLMEDTSSTNKRKIPLLGDIPVIGFLFSTTQKAMSKSNLLIFITPYIIKDRTDFSAILKRKVKERNRFIDANYSKSKRRKIRQTIKTHREDLLEFREDLGMGKTQTPVMDYMLDDGTKKKVTPVQQTTRPVITAPPQSPGISTRGTAIPTTPAIDASSWRPVTPPPTYAPVTPPPPPPVVAPTPPPPTTYTPPPTTYTAPKSTYKEQKSKVKEDTKQVIEETIQEKSTASKAPAPQWLPKTTAPKVEEKIQEEIKEEVKIYKKPTVPTPAFNEPRAYIKKVPISPAPPVEETIKETIKKKDVDKKVKEEIKEEIKVYEKPTVPTPAFDQPRAYLKKVPVAPAPQVEETVKETIKKEVEKAPEAIAPPPVITAPPVEDDIKTYKKPAPGSRQNGGIDMAY